jgi:hypothetical protein
VSSRIALLTATVVAAVGLTVPAAGAQANLIVGVNDEAQTLYGYPDIYFPVLKQLHMKVLRVNLYWGGRFGVANKKPVNAANPADPAYQWNLYDRTVRYAFVSGVKMMFTIYGSPKWASGSSSINRAPKNAKDLQLFAYAVARRYSGTYTPTKPWPGETPGPLPAVRYWTAWNEPNNPVFLLPQWSRVKVAGVLKWVPQAAINYAKICNAVYNGVHATAIASEKVACGTTAPRGSNSPIGRASIAPLTFLGAVKKYGLKRFDAWAHHPYYNRPSETPASKPAKATGAVTMGNIGDMLAKISQLYGPKHLWITEYGYQTNPPDNIFGVSFARQALYMNQAFAMAKANPRIDMMLWFLLKDDARPAGWQSGILTASGDRKPSFETLEHIGWSYP